MTPAGGIVLDIQATQSAEYGERGIARWVTGLADALLDRPGALRGLHLNPVLARPHLPYRLATAGLVREESPQALRTALGDGPATYVLGHAFDIDIRGGLHAPAHVLAGSVALGAVLYDVIPLKRPATHLDPWPDRARRFHSRADLVRSCDVVLAISEWSGREGVDLLGLDPRRVHAVGTGVTEHFTPGDSGPAATGIDGSYVFSVTGGDSRKNTDGLIRAWAVLPVSVRRDHRLVVTCHATAEQERLWRTLAGDVGLRDGELILTGRVDDDRLRALYRGCALFVMPSFDEGFGLPLAEAMCCGAATVAADASSLPEVLGDREGTFDPHDPEAIADALAAPLVDAELGARLRARSARRRPALRWDAVAARVCEHLASTGRDAAVPLAAAVIGVGTEADALVDRLRGEGWRVTRLGGTEAGVLPLSALGRWVHPAGFDAVAVVAGAVEDDGALARRLGVPLVSLRPHTRSDVTVLGDEVGRGLLAAAGPVAVTADPSAAGDGGPLRPAPWAP